MRQITFPGLLFMYQVLVQPVFQGINIFSYAKFLLKTIKNPCI